MSEATIPIKELMEKTEQWLLGQGYKKSTLGFYRATWNRFLSYSASPHECIGRDFSHGNSVPP